MFIYQVYYLFLLYLSRPISTSVQIIFDKELPFPAVTICNLNMIRQDATGVLKQFDIKLGSNYSGEGGGQNKCDDNDDSYQDYWDSDSSLPDEDDNDQEENEDDDQDENEDIEDDYPPDPCDVHPEMRRQEEIANIIGEFKEDELVRAGHSFSEMIVNCSWKGWNCKTGKHTKYWTRSWNNKYGNCYTFNNGFDNNGRKLRILKASQPGPTQALTLRVNIQQSQYVGSISMEAGVRVLLHDQGVMPFPYENGFSVTPGMATSIGFKKKKIIRLDRFQNKSCWPEKELPKENIYRKDLHITRYSQQACLNSCLGFSQRNQCNCSENAYPSRKSCNIFERKTKICLRKVKDRFINKCLQECQQPCIEELLQKTISLSQWPSKNYQMYRNNHDTAYGQSDPENLLLIKVFYEELNYEKIEERYSYMFINLLADIGGQLGLWIGISAITCCEVLELFIRFFSHIIRSKFKLF